MARQTSGQAGGSQSTNQDAPVIVAIGASAGGIQVLQKLFRTMPHQTGAAYVVVVHLDPHRHSDLPHILAACTPIPVVQVEGTEKIEADHVYVIPPDRRLQMVDHQISAIPFDDRMACDRRSTCSPVGCRKAWRRLRRDL
jgi:two-component system CheB/CheR fusion protein